jgi:RNA polymerase sigma factor (sigma-70 family)
MPAVRTGAILRHLQQLAETQSAQGLTDRQLLQRFVQRREGDAFAALMRRHGRLVWGVCRHVLRREHDAEDAFQAAFLVLARRAASIRNLDSLASWLHGVAFRLAMNARRSATKRTDRERRAVENKEDASASDLGWRDLQAILDEELQRLPDRYRAPFVLCCLEGRSRAEAAAELGWKDGTISSRIATARRLLQDRLTRRGVTLPAVLTAGVLWGQSASACVPAALVKSALKSALLMEAGCEASRAVAPSVAALVKDGMKTVALAKLKIAAALMLAASLLGGIGWAVSPRPDEEAQQPKHEPNAKSEKSRSDLDGFPLPPEAIARLGTMRLRHSGNIESLHFTPDGKILISRGEGGVRTWETATGKLLHSFPKESEGGDPAGASLSPDGKLLATPGEKTLQIWEMATAKLLRSIEIDTGKSLRGRLLFTCFSADGKMLASQNGDSLNEVSLWDPAGGRQISRWTASKQQITFLAFVDDGKTLLTASYDKSIRLWDAATGEPKQEIRNIPTDISARALSRDGKLMATVGYTAKPAGANVIVTTPHQFIQIWDTTTEKETGRLDEPKQDQKDEETAGFRSVTFTPDGKIVLACTGPGTVYAFDLIGAMAPRPLWQSSTRAQIVAASPDGKAVALATGAAIHLLDLASGKEILHQAGHADSAYKTALTPDGRMAVTASGSDLYLWDTASGRLRKRLQGHNGYINGLELIDGGRKAVTSAYQDATLRVWDLIAGKETGRIESTDKANILQAVSPDGKTIAVGGSNSLTVLFDVRTGKEIQRLEGYGKFNDYGAAFTPDGRTLVVWYCDDNMVYHWDLATGKKVREYAFIDGDPPQANLPNGRPVYFAAVSPDGRTIAFGSQSRLLELRDLATGELLHRLTKLPDGVCPVAFSPDSRLLAWSGWWGDPSVHLIEVATGRECHCFVGHIGRVLSLSFSADGKKLISGSADTTALVWDLTGKLAAGDEWAKPLTAKRIEAVWSHLAEDDAARAYQIIRRLSAAPREPVAFLREKLKPVAAVDVKRVAQLIADLDAEDFAVRERATQELETLGEAAADACRKALEAASSAESRRRLERLVSKQAREMGTLSPERLRTLRALGILERAGTAEARELLEALANGGPGSLLTREAKAALERVARRAP